MFKASEEPDSAGAGVSGGLCRLLVVVACCAWVSLAAWAISTLPVYDIHTRRLDLAEGLIVALGLSATLMLRAWSRDRDGVHYPLLSIVLLSIVWAAVVAEVLVRGSDALGLAALHLAMLADRAQRRAASAVLAGCALGLSPLLVGGIVLLGGVRGARQVVLLAASAAAVLLAGAALGHDPWESVRPVVVLHRFNITTIWRQYSWWTQMMLPVLCLGVLGVAGGDEAIAVRQKSRNRLWIVLNAVLLLAFSKSAYSHAVVWVLPFGHATGDGLRTLHLLDRPSVPFTVRLICVTGVLFTLWMLIMPLETAHAVIIPALVGS